MRSNKRGQRIVHEVTEIDPAARSVTFDARTEPGLTYRELVVKLKQVLTESGLDVESQIQAFQEVRGSLQRPSAHYRAWVGPLTKPGEKKKAKERE